MLVKLQLEVSHTRRNNLYKLKNYKKAIAIETSMRHGLEREIIQGQK